MLTSPKPGHSLLDLEPGTGTSVAVGGRPVQLAKVVRSLVRRNNYVIPSVGEGRQQSPTGDTAPGRTLSTKKGARRSIVLFVSIGEAVMANGNVLLA